MRISRVELPGFGCLSGFSCEMSGGLNVFYGENEAGKSTLQQAVSAMLYGFFEADRALRDETARHERFRPWSGGVYRGALEYELDDGRRFEVRRDFATADVITQVIDEMGTDVSAQFGRGRHGNVPFARKHLGMSRGVFQSCAFISQGEIFELQKNASPSEIGDAIAALADSARRDVSAAKAVERLDAALGKIGSDRARTADLPVAREKLAAAKRELAATDAARQEMAEKSRRLEQLQAKARQLEEQVLRADYLLQRAEAAKQRRKIAEIEDARAAHEAAESRRDGLVAYVSLTTAMRDEVVTLRGQIQRAAEAVARIERDRADAAGGISDDDRLEYESLRLSVGALSNEQIASLQAQAREQAPVAATGIARAVGAVLRAVVAAASAVVRFVLRRKAAAADETPAPEISQSEALALLDRHRRYLTLRPLVERLQMLDQQLDVERAGLASLAARLEGTFRSAGVEQASLDAGAREFEAAWRRREEYQQAANDTAAAESRLTQLLNGPSEDELGGRLLECEGRVHALLEEHPRLRECTSNQSPEQLARTLQQFRDDLHKTEMAASGLREEVRVTLERYRPRAEIEEDAAILGTEVARLERARAAATLAKETIQEAMTKVYRDFAPAVNSFLSEGIEIATEGRYRRAHVDPATLKVSLLVPETDQVVIDPPVSHGTRTLMYVLMRVGLAQHMSAIGEPVPLVLDDPFVDVDSRRLERMLEFLLVLSERMQVLLFTKDREIADWLESKGANSSHQVHRLSTTMAASL